jgi:hypothetical protein
MKAEHDMQKETNKKGIFANCIYNIVSIPSKIVNLVPGAVEAVERVLMGCSTLGNIFSFFSGKK